MVLTHRGKPAAEEPTHTAGWAHYLKRLAMVATGAEPGPDPGPA